jgi:outer membrane lipoprotein SlyB
MKTFVVAMLLVAGLALTGCGSSNNNSGNINGNWNAALTDTGGNAVFGFATSLVVNGDGTLVVSNFKFATNSFIPAHCNRNVSTVIATQGGGSRIRPDRAQFTRWSSLSD